MSPTDYRKGLLAEDVRRLFHYSQISGEFKRRKTTSRHKRGTIAGTIGTNGYVCIGIEGTVYKAHRLAWLYVTGDWPSGEIDHINGDRTDNRWANLRPVRFGENSKNMKLRTTNKSGVSGVMYCERGDCKRWKVSIGVRGEKIYLGYYEDFFEAVCVRKSAELHHGYHENHGRAA